MASRYRSRRGSFGLQPRVAPNITGQIIALAREYAAKRDQNIMDAWRNGGTFEGKKVTDEMVLKYWQEKGEGLDKDDPNYNAISNQIMQLQYGIEQSKQDLLHLQGRISDSQYAQFFIKWSRKVPRNSEFYRALQKDAAQLIESARQKSKAAAEQARTDRFNAFVTRTTNKKIAVANYLTKALNDLAEQTGMTVTGNGDLLLSMLTTDVKQNPNKYHGLTDALKKADPDFDGNITEAYFTGSINSATQGYADIADRARKGGFVSAYASAVQSESSMAQWGQNVKTWPVAQSYTAADEALQRAWNDPTASQMEKLDAAARAAATYESLANTPNIDAGTREQLLADAARLRGQDAGDAPSYGSAQLGRSGVPPEVAMTIGAWTQTRAEMQANPAAWAYAPTDRNGNFDPTGSGPVGIVPRGSVPSGAVAVMIPTGTGGSVLSYVQPQPIYTTDPNTGQEVYAGSHIGYNVGGKAVELWAYVDADNKAHWSTTSPLVAGAGVTYDGNGAIHVTQPQSAAADPIAMARAYAADPKWKNYSTELTGLANQMQAAQDAGQPVDGISFERSIFDPKTKTTMGKAKATFENGVLKIGTTENTVDPETGQITQSAKTPYVLPIGNPRTGAWSQSAITAGDIPGATFDSPLAASVSAARYTQTQDQARSLANDPEFQQQFIAQTMNTLQIDNPYDARIAQAWKAATTGDASATYNSQVKALVDKGVPPAAARNHLREDLHYPGYVAPAGNEGNINVRFGAQTLNIPGMPNYMGKNKTLTPQEMGQAFGQNGILSGVVAPPTFGPPAPTAQQAAPAATPTATPTVAPTASVKPPAATSAPTATAAPSPTPNPLYGPMPTPSPKPR